MAAALDAFEQAHYAKAAMEVARKATEYGANLDTLNTLTDELRNFINLKVGQRRTDQHETAIFFEQEGRRGFLMCKYIHNGTAFYDRPLYDKVGEPQPMLNISHVVIGPPTEGVESGKNLIARVCEELIPETHLAGIRIEAILSRGFLDNLLARGWIEYDRNSSAIWQNPSLKSGGRRRTRKKSTRRRDKSRKFYKR